MLDKASMSFSNVDLFDGDNLFESQTTPSKRPKRRAANSRNYAEGKEDSDENVAGPSKKPIGTPKNKSETSEKMVECPICLQKFTETLVAEHASDCTPKDTSGDSSGLVPESEASRDTGTGKRGGAKHVCEACQKTFVRLTVFENHKDKCRK